MNVLMNCLLVTCYQYLLVRHVPVNLALLVPRSLSSVERSVIVGFSQAIGTRIKLAHALAQQWFGVFITPDSPADGKPGALVQLYLVCNWI